MRFNFAKRLRMSAQLYILVAVIPVMFTGQAVYMMKHVSETEKTLKAFHEKVIPSLRGARPSS